tara:strand:+ start:340 stop:576 length:237 start_codon:yes stop_codon:yes gene_type:complete
MSKNITFEQRKFKRKETLGQYLKKRMKGCRVTGIRGEWLYVKEPFADELDFWIQQYKIKEGHSEWSERYKINIWIEDE